MQIVEQEQRPQNPGVLDDRRATLRLGHGPMLGERAHHGKARAGIDEAGKVNPQRHPADCHHPDQHRRAQDEVARESAARAAVVAPCVARQLADEAPDQKRRTDYDASEEGRLGVRDRAPDWTEAAPTGFSPVIALRVIERISQICVPVVRQMRRAIDRIRKPQRQGPAGNRLVDAAVPTRMAMNNLVLQVQLPGDDPGAERGQAPPRQVPVEICRQQPQPVNGDREPGRRPFDAAFERRKFDNLHEFRPLGDARESPSRIG